MLQRTLRIHRLKFASQIKVVDVGCFASSGRNSPWKAGHSHGMAWKMLRPRPSRNLGLFELEGYHNGLRQVVVPYKETCQSWCEKQPGCSVWQAQTWKDPRAFAENNMKDTCAGGGGGWTEGLLPNLLEHHGWRSWNWHSLAKPRKTIFLWPRLRLQLLPASLG